ncbi:tyrosine-type recombinase/integrase [Fluviispira multicolorata]|uniref:Tyrosine-type recombinase/integrase n=1 Tax=Fluviispira multicolorata TaxID=2654512 RepID=A0A833JFS3_9BACT|nr:tyrosine-type recombinase/integrase [Fluviispira multicolorata]KAB8031812.1 tyrosine-type recombinase/integrase [Fluviispira multicolorata]
MSKNHNEISHRPLPETTIQSRNQQLSFNSKEALSLWAQKPLSQNLNDTILHFIMSFQSIHTQKNYLNDLKSFLNFTSNINYKCESISEVNEKILITWHEYLSTKTNLSQVSIRRKLMTLSSFLEFCFKRDLIKENAMKFIRLPKLIEQSKTNAFTESESKKIVAYLKNEWKILSEKSNQCVRKYKAAYLKYAVISTLFSVGMRVNELCEIKISDLEFNEDFSRVHLKTKGNKDHAPFLHDTIAKLIKNYVNEMRSEAKENEYLFIRTQDVKNVNKLSQVAIYNMIVDTAQKVGIEKKVSPHSCRATLATLLHKKGTPIASIQKILNHNSITTTAIYIKKADELQEAAATKINIMENKK